MEKIKKLYPQFQCVEERITHSREFMYVPGLEEVQKESGRCMDCGIPFCHAWGCPLGNVIPEINRRIREKDLYEAFKLIEEGSMFPEITGRLCPALCEASCSLSINDYPVSFKCIELSLAETAFENGWVVPKLPAAENRLKAAVIGSGPSGLAAAVTLRRAGFSVTVYEKNDSPGGLLRYGIPSFKLEKQILDRRINLLEQEGIIFQNRVTAGDDISPGYLRQLYDVIVIAAGAGTPRNIKAIGSGYDNIIHAVDYLYSRENPVSARGKKVLILGGGDTGADCAGTAVRQGAERICQYEIMPLPPVHEGPGNPSWPEYPRIHKNTSSHEEGGERDWGVEVYQFTGREINAEKAYCRKVEWKTDPVSGRNYFHPVYGSDFTIDVDLVIVAAGFIHTEHSILLNRLGIAFDSAGNIKTDESGKTNIEGIYAAGDCTTGASLIARAINSGRNTAGGIIKKYCEKQG